MCECLYECVYVCVCVLVPRVGNTQDHQWQRRSQSLERERSGGREGERIPSEKAQRKVKVGRSVVQVCVDVCV